jgi:MFS superfamily sulfate permease-like transporter
VLAERVPGVLLLRPEVPLFFANAEGVLAEVRRRIVAASPHAVVLSLEETPDLDGTALEALCALAAECAAQGRPIVLARLKEPALEVLRRVAAPGLDAAALEVGSVDDAVRRVASTASTASTASARAA